MNNVRRNRLKFANECIERASRQIDIVTDEENEALNNIPDSLRESDNAIVIEESVEDLSAASIYINLLVERINRIIER